MTCVTYGYVTHVYYVRPNPYVRMYPGPFLTSLGANSRVSDGDVHQMVADGVAVLVGVVGAVLLCTGYCTAINWP